MGLLDYLRDNDWTDQTQDAPTVPMSPLLASPMADPSTGVSQFRPSLLVENRPTRPTENMAKAGFWDAAMGMQDRAQQQIAAEDALRRDPYGDDETDIAGPGISPAARQQLTAAQILNHLHSTAPYSPFTPGTGAFGNLDRPAPQIALGKSPKEEAVPGMSIEELRSLLKGVGAPASRGPYSPETNPVDAQWAAQMRSLLTGR